MMKKSPAVHFFNAGGALNDCLAKDKEQLHPLYTSKFGMNGVCLESALYGNGAYGGKKWGQVGDGLHSTTRLVPYFFNFTYI